MSRNSKNIAMILGAKHQLAQLRPMIQELSSNWDNSDAVDLTAKERANGVDNIVDFAITLHCIKDGGVEVIVNVKTQGFSVKGFVEREKDISIINYRSFEECLNYLADFDQTAEFWGDCLYNEVC